MCYLRTFHYKKLSSSLIFLKIQIKYFCHKPAWKWGRSTFSSPVQLFDASVMLIRMLHKSRMKAVKSQFTCRSHTPSVHPWVQVDVWAKSGDNLSSQCWRIAFMRTEWTEGWTAQKYKASSRSSCQHRGIKKYIYIFVFIRGFLMSFLVSESKTLPFEMFNIMSG